MSASERVRTWFEVAVDTVREDTRSATESEHALLHAIRFLVEIPAAVGLVFRSLCYLGAAVVMETARLGEDPVFDDSYGVVLRYNWLGPGWEHDRQTVTEVRLASAFCVIWGFVLYETLAYFDLSMIERVFLWTTCGALVLDPAWARIYTSITDTDGFPSERDVWENGPWPF